MDSELLRRAQQRQLEEALAQAYWYREPCGGPEEGDGDE